MSPPLARAFARIASTLFAFAALVLIGFASSPAGFAASDLPVSLLIQQDAAAPDEGDMPLAAEPDEPSSQEATLPAIWQMAERSGASSIAAGPPPGGKTGLTAPDRPPPRSRSDLRSGSLGML